MSASPGSGSQGKLQDSHNFPNFTHITLGSKAEVRSTSASLPGSNDLEHLHHLIPEVVDHLYRNPPGLRLLERPGGVAVERGPGFFVDFGLEGGLQRAVGVVGTEEVGVADEKAF
jgi:hypothetical protein